jgi:uncharacterized protein involved in response to NO
LIRIKAERRRAGNPADTRRPGRTMPRLPPGPQSAPTRFQVITAAPHRLAFLAGMTQVVAPLVWWTETLIARHGSLPQLGLTLAPAHAHLFLMVYGLFPFFIFGFLFTVYPRWMGGAPIARRHYVSVYALLVTGMLSFYAGLHASRMLLFGALALYMAGWIGALAALYRVYVQARQRGPHERLLNLALAAGLGGVGMFLIGVWRNEMLWFSLARECGLWLFLAPVVFLVAHRMIPFFSQSALVNYVLKRPVWGPPFMLMGVTGHAAFEILDLAEWRFLADLPLAIVALHLTWLWQFRKSFHARLVAMLHIAFLWLGIAMLLYTLQSLALLATGTDFFGRAPLHALGIGFFTGMIVAMASRVTLGHSGHAVAADTLTWIALLGVNVTAIMRIAAEFLPASQTVLNVLAALAWLVFLLPWVVRYAPLTLRPRLDNQPG